MTAYYNEFDPKAAAWLRELIKRGLIADGVVDERSILDVSADDLRGFTQCHFFAGIGGWSYALRLAGWSDDRPVWTGSPPCQPFSVAGEGLSKDDPRHLAPHFVRLVGACRPPVLFGEQVASADVFGKVAGKSGKGPASAPRWAWLDDLQDRLEAAHYAFGASDIPAAGIGAPHIRQRTFFGAYDLRSAAGGVADADRRERDGFADGEGRRADREATGRDESDGKSQRSGSPDRLADASSPRGEAGVPEQAQREEGLPEIPDYGGGGFSGPVEGRPGADWMGGNLNTGWPGQDNGPWRDADWLFCRDGKWRSVEPGTFPLAHGLPDRVGLLRGYGNAIVPQAAAAFIESFEVASA
jgi:DNA (cytosine-5)-methyltransferase 1